MLFMITHTHTAENCSAHKPEQQKAFAQAMTQAKDLGVILHAAYVCAPAHTVFFVIEAEAMESIHKSFDPMLEYGTATFYPVLDLAAAQKLLGPE